MPIKVNPSRCLPMKSPFPASCGHRSGQSAFTLTELLVVAAVIAVLVLLNVSALAHSQASSDRGVCANNLRRLMQAWQMYADDYSGRLMGNASASGSGTLNWVAGWLDFNPANADNTNPLKLTNSTYAAMGFYLNSPSLFRCPANLSSVIVLTVPKLRVRSYSMNTCIGTGATAWNPGFQVMTKVSEVCQPERTFVLLEEHPDSINDGAFITDLAGVGTSLRIVDFPAYYHRGAANLAMADGHVELWQWRDARTMPPGMFVGNVASPNNPDVVRLQQVASYRQ